MKHILICDDEPQVLVALQKAVNHMLKENHRVDTFSSCSALIAFLRRQETDQPLILLLDIMMGNESSIPISAELLKRMPNLRIIYVTGQLERCEEIFFSSPSGFLVKPVKEEQLAFLLKKVGRELEERAGKKICVFSRNGRLEEISAAQILYVESRGRIATIHTLHTAIECNMKLNELALLLPDFLRPHQSYLVNCSYLRSAKRLELTLNNGKRIPIARARSPLVLEYLTSLEQT